MIKNTLIIILLLLVIYLYYQQKKNPDFSTTTSLDNELDNLKKSLDKLIEENEDYETEVDTLTRTKNSLEQDLTAQSNAFKSRLREKDGELKRLKEDLTSEKQQHKGSLERINKLTQKITNLEKIPGQFPPEDLTQEHQEQLRKIYALFDLRAQGFKEIDFNQLYGLLQKVSKKVDLSKIHK